MKISSIVKVSALCVVMFSVTGCDPDRIARGLQVLDEAYGVNGKYTHRYEPAPQTDQFNPNQCNAGGRPVYRQGGSGYYLSCEQ